MKITGEAVGDVTGMPTQTRMIDMVELKPCPFCGADADLRWVLDETRAANGHGGKALRVSCSRDGECPSPSWVEASREHESDAECLHSVTSFWNARAEDWEPDEMLQLRVRLAQVESELRVTRIERDRAQKACEQISKAHEATT